MHTLDKTSEFMTYIVHLQDQFLSYIITETESGEEVNFTTSDSLLTFVGDCSKAYQIQANLKVVASVGKL